MTAEEMLSYQDARDKLIQTAVAATDRVILGGCCGNPEVLMLLTSEVAVAFAKKTSMMLRTEVYKKEILCEVDPELL